METQLLTKNIFKKITTQWDASNYWRNKKIQDFKIDLEKVDRLYYIYRDENEEKYVLVCRMQGEFYIKMTAFCCNCCAEFMDRGFGTIFVSRDPILFMKFVLPKKPRYNKKPLYIVKNHIYESLEKDGIYIDEEEQITKTIATISISNYIQTHPNFKSIVKNVQTADTMDDQVGRAIDRQKSFEKNTTSFETAFYWKNKNIQDFKIDLEKVDRLYYIYCDENEEKYDLICRMQREFYIIMKSTNRGSGCIFFCRDPDSFMKCLLLYHNKTLIHESLKKDGIYPKDGIDKKERKSNKIDSEKMIR